MRQFFVIIVVVIVLVGLVFWAFRSPAKPSSSPTPTSAPADANQNPFEKNVVTIENSAFNPAEITISAGEPVNFKNQDSQVHTTTFEEFDTGEIKPGSSVIHAFNKTGTFEYHCSIHPSMKGKVIVQ